MNPQPSDPSQPASGDGPPPLVLKTSEELGWLSLKRVETRKNLQLRPKRTGTTDKFPPGTLPPAANPPRRLEAVRLAKPLQQGQAATDRPPEPVVAADPPATPAMRQAEPRPQPTIQPVSPLVEAARPVSPPGAPPSSNALRLRKKQEPVVEGGRDVPLQPVANPTCYNCRVPFATDVPFDPLARVTCPRCGTRQVMPARIGEFLLERELGQGGMGTTYRAFDTSLQRNVAVKLLTEHATATRDTIDGMIREARRAAAISHPHIVPIYSIGSVEGMPYLVMELLSDGMLARPVARGEQLGETFVIKTGLAIARGLAAAADLGMLHLDVKPANILHDRFGVAKLIDFGLACNLHDSHKEVWGTCLYMAPERLRHRTQDFRSDQYSLGLALWHALAGKPPFDARDQDQLVDKILGELPPLINGIRADINDWTAGLIHKMIAYNPEERYQDYAQLVWAFEFVLDALQDNPSESAANTSTT